MKLMGFKNDNKNGQSLIEILVALGVGTIMLVGAITAFAPAIKSQSDVNRGQVGTALAVELMDNVRVFAEANWHNIDSIDVYDGGCSRIDCIDQYAHYLNTATSPFSIAPSVATGTEIILTASTTFYRDFYLTKVNRDTSGSIVGFGVGANDPSTRLLTVEYWWGSVSKKEISTYLTRYSDRTLRQTDWSGGGNVNGPASTTLGNKFATSSGIDYSTSTGSIRIFGL